MTWVPLIATLSRVRPRADTFNAISSFCTVHCNIMDLIIDPSAVTPFLIKPPKSDETSILACMPQTVADPFDGVAFCVFRTVSKSVDKYFKPYIKQKQTKTPRCQPHQIPTPLLVECHDDDVEEWSINKALRARIAQYKNNRVNKKQKQQHRNKSTTSPGLPH